MRLQMQWLSSSHAALLLPCCSSCALHDSWSDRDTLYLDDILIACNFINTHQQYLSCVYSLTVHWNEFNMLLMLFSELVLTRFSPAIALCLKASTFHLKWVVKKYKTTDINNSSSANTLFQFINFDTKTAQSTGSKPWVYEPLRGLWMWFKGSTNVIK